MTEIYIFFVKLIVVQKINWFDIVVITCLVNLIVSFFFFFWKRINQID